MSVIVPPVGPQLISGNIFFPGPQGNPMDTPSTKAGITNGDLLVAWLIGTSKFQGPSVATLRGPGGHVPPSH